MEWIYAIPTDHRPFVNELEEAPVTETPVDVELTVVSPPVIGPFPRVLSSRHRFLLSRKPWQDELKPPCDPPSRWWRLLLYCVTLSLALSPWFQIAAIFNQLLELYHVSVTEGLVLIAMTPVGFGVGGLISGYCQLSDRIAPRYLFPAACVGVIIANLLSFVEVYGFVIFLRLTIGALMALIFPPTIKLCSTWFYYRRGVAVGVLIGSVCLGTAIPSLIRGIGLIDWRILIGVTSACCGVSGLLMYAFGQEGPLKFPPIQPGPIAILPAFRSIALLLNFLGFIGHMWEAFALWAWFPFFIEQAMIDDGYGESEAAQLASVVTFFMIGSSLISCPLAGWMTDQIGRTYTCMFWSIISGTCALLIGLAFDSIPAISIVGVLWGASMSADSAQFSCITAEVCPQHLVGTFLTFQIALGYFFSVPPIFIVQVTESSWTWIWAFSFLAFGPYLSAITLYATRYTRDAHLICAGKK